MRTLRLPAASVSPNTLRTCASAVDDAGDTSQVGVGADHPARVVEANAGLLAVGSRADHLPGDGGHSLALAGSSLELLDKLLIALVLWDRGP